MVGSGLRKLELWQPFPQTFQQGKPFSKARYKKHPISLAVNLIYRRSGHSDEVGKTILNVQQYSESSRHHPHREFCQGFASAHFPGLPDTSLNELSPRSR